MLNANYDIFAFFVVQSVYSGVGCGIRCYHRESGHFEIKWDLTVAEGNSN